MSAVAANIHKASGSIPLRYAPPATAVMHCQAGNVTKSPKADITNVVNQTMNDMNMGFNARNDIQESVERIKRVFSMSLEPDNEDDIPVAAQTAVWAETIVRRSAREAYISAYEWQKPYVSSTPNGELSLAWRNGAKSASLIISAEKSGVVLVTIDEYRKAKRLVTDEAKAINSAISILENVGRMA